MKNNKEKRIRQIKDCGQSIIDNAETIYGDYKYPQGVKIVIDIPVGEPPTITTVREFVPEGLIENQCF